MHSEGGTPEPPAVVIPDAFRRRYAAWPAGAAWVDGLPARLVELARAWRLTLGAPFPLTSHYVAPVTRADGTAAVLKVGPPGGGVPRELAALRHLAGPACVRLLAAAPERDALLLERVRPGTPLAATTDGADDDRDDRATVVLAGLMRTLWRPATEVPFPYPLREWLAGELGVIRRHAEGAAAGRWEANPVPAELLAAAEALLTGPLATAPPGVVLHGDLHHLNVLATGGPPPGGGRGAAPPGWVAIDPLGFEGDPAFEPAVALYNGFAAGPESVLLPKRLGRTLHRRIDRYARELGLERERIRAWGLVRAVVSTWWSYQNGSGTWPYTLACAAALR
jgi:streptomycin 6-kinase